ncbi:MAG: hypothetical protein HQ485_09310 [Acidobacteria bacterium]|jgi:hypothetical protein|nr:hypothetical protein [Acidobacteriota bacterium]
MHTTGLAVAVIAALSGACASRLETPPDSFTIGVVSATEYGIVLQPIARLTKSEWLNTWPTLEETDLIPTLDQIPDTWLDGAVPVTWRFSPPRGPSRDVKVVNARRGDSVCYAPVELVLEGEGAGAPPENSAPAFFGIATSSDVPVAYWVEVPRQGEEVGRLFAAIDAALRKIERQTVDAFLFPEGLPSPGMLSSEKLQATAITKLMRSNDDAEGRTYWFDAVRRAHGDQWHQMHGVALEGWVRVERGAEPVVFGQTGRVRWEMESGARHTPLAIIRHHDRDFWVLRRNYYESTGYDTTEVSFPDAFERAKANGGGC